jgi:hypothetical protein
MSLLGGLVVATCGIATVALANVLIEAWMGRSFPDQRLLVALVAGFYVIMAITAPYNMILNSMGKTRAQIVAWGVFLCVTVVTKLILTEASSLWIVPLISLVGYGFVISPSMIWIASRHLDRAATAAIVHQEST